MEIKKKSDSLFFAGPPMHKERHFFLSSVCFTRVLRMAPFRTAFTVELLSCPSLPVVAAHSSLAAEPSVETGTREYILTKGGTFDFIAVFQVYYVSERFREFDVDFSQTPVVFRYSRWSEETKFTLLGNHEVGEPDFEDGVPRHPVLIWIPRSALNCVTRPKRKKSKKDLKAKLQW